MVTPTRADDNKKIHKKKYSHDNNNKYQRHPSSLHGGGQYPSSAVVWSWFDRGQWVPFDSGTNDELEEAQQKNYSEKKFKVSGHYYCVDFEQMKQYRLYGKDGGRNLTKFRQVKREAPSSFLSTVSQYVSNWTK